MVKSWWNQDDIVTLMIWSFWITILGTSHQEAWVEHCNLHVILKLISGHVTWSKKQMDHLVWENLCLHQTKSVAPNLDIGHRLHHRRAFRVKIQNTKILIHFFNTTRNHFDPLWKYSWSKVILIQFWIWRRLSNVLSWEKESKG